MRVLFRSGSAQLSPCSRPPAASLRPRPPAPSPPLLSPLHALRVVLPSPPTQSEILSPSLENHCVLQTLCPHPPAPALRPPSCTFATTFRRRTDRKQIALPSTPDDLNTLAPRLLLRYTTLPPLPQ